MAPLAAGLVASVVRKALRMTGMGRSTRNRRWGWGITTHGLGRGFKYIMIIQTQNHLHQYAYNRLNSAVKPLLPLPGVVVVPNVLPRKLPLREHDRPAHVWPWWVLVGVAWVPPKPCAKTDAMWPYLMVDNLVKDDNTFRKTFWSGNQAS